MSILRTITEGARDRRRRRPSAPGEILRELYLEPRRVSLTAFAAALGCSRKHVSNVVNGKARIEPELAARIAAVLGTSAELWLNLQNAVDLHDAAQALKGWKPARSFHAA
jgi:antitoxin HigA-1